MKKTFFVICLLAVSQWLAATENIDSLLNVLDEIVLNHQQYSNKKEEELHKLKELLTITSSGQQQFIVCGQLFDNESGDVLPDCTSAVSLGKWSL